MIVRYCRILLLCWFVPFFQLRTVSSFAEIQEHGPHSRRTLFPVRDSSMRSSAEEFEEMFEWRQGSRFRRRARGEWRSGLVCARGVGALEARCLLTVGVDGWTELSPSADSRLIYVSSSLGNDSNDGLSPQAPKRTITSAYGQMRHGFPDWILLRRGDVFSEQTVVWEAGGRSVAEPMVLTAYGNGPRPVLSETQLFYWGPNMPAGFSLNYLAIAHLEFQGKYSSNPAPDYNSKAILFSGHMNHILLEGNSFDDYRVNVHLRPFAMNGEKSSNIAIRRNVFTDGATQGIIMAGPRDVLLEENVFDSNGFGDGGPSVLHHNVYFTHITGLVARGNIFARGGNFGTKLSADDPSSFTGFLVEDNLYYNNGIGLDHSAGPSGDIQTTFTHQDGIIRNNVFTALGREFANGSRQDLVGWLLNSRNVEWAGNLFVDKPEFSGHHALMWQGHHADIRIHGNVVHRWNPEFDSPPSWYLESNSQVIDGLQADGNDIDLPDTHYVDSARTVGTYYASVGGVDNAEAFIQAARAMSRENWNTAFQASAVNEYLRQGFARVLAAPAFQNAPSTRTPASKPEISWSGVDGADSYEVWYSSLTTGENPSLNETTLATTFAPESALGIGRYQIWVRALQDVGPPSDWSDPITMQITTPPKLQSLPSDGYDATPELNWTEVPGAARFEVWANNLTTGKAQIIHETQVTGATFTPAAPLGFGKYRFWIRAFDTGGRPGDWSAPQDYSRTDVSTIIEPVVFDGVSSQPTIRWQPVDGATSYEIAGDNVTLDLIRVIDQSGLAVAEFTPGSPLAFGQYRLWVRPVDSDGLTAKWSPTSVSNNAPAGIAPVAPTFDVTPTFSWGALPAAATYELYLTHEDGSTTQIQGVESASWTPATSLRQGRIDWWVRPFANDGTNGPWSRMARTNIGGRPTVTYAGIPEKASDGKGVFEWTPVSGASRYVLHVVRVNWGVIIQEDYLTETSFTSASRLPAGEYRVWVKAIDARDDSSGMWSYMVKFTISAASVPQILHEKSFKEQVEASLVASELGASRPVDESLRPALPFSDSDTAADPVPQGDDQRPGGEGLGDETARHTRNGLMTDHQAELIDLIMGPAQRALFNVLT